jgi:hypothetical protein
LPAMAATGTTFLNSARAIDLDGVYDPLPSQRPIASWHEGQHQRV